MPLYIDRHNVEPFTPEQIAQAHLRDLELQARFGVNYLTYWFGEGNKSLFCLVDAPSKEAAFAVHNESHGNVSSDIIEVSYSSIGTFIGKTDGPAPGETWTETAFRAILFSSTGDTHSLDDQAAAQMRRAHESLVREAIEGRGGRDCGRKGNGMIGSFPSVVAALECALAIQRSADQPAPGRSAVPVSIGLSAGEPVQDHGELFGAAVSMATALCDVVPAGGILASSVVRDLALGKGFVFSERGDTQLKGFDDPVRTYAVEGKSEPATDTSTPPAVAPARLTAREVEVLRLIARGRTNQEIGDELVISLHTVARHVSNIFDKTGVANRAEAASFAHVHQLV